ncbi:PD-(D/E)XK nuclease family protein [uncultured Lamprocystis sp.]|jgi:hypothetical protein|uniref:PDDEXK-like family protein n=1 Tax=uncultured Lamprocystis sp. TaxID=543132 RepID=UPI0025EA539E|nr:PD-(D/E)XK nuclease family protein [uncultured Lamprocystis sp.]
MPTPTVPVSPLAGLADFFTTWRCIHLTAPENPSAEPAPELAVQLGRFFTAWAENHNALFRDTPIPESLADQLQRFFAAWQPLHTPIDHKQSVPTIDWAARVIEMTLFFEDFRPALQAQAALHSQGSLINVWEVSGLGWNELRNSKVLAWLLDCRGTHGQGAKILATLLEGIPSDIKDFPKSGTTDLPYWTRVESCPLGEKDSRVDIEIDGEGLLLFIEIKIGAVETAKQLDRYLAIAKARARGRPWGVIYLTRYGQLPSRYQDAGTDVPLIPVSWSDVIKAIERQIETLPDCFTKIVLRQFVEHIQSFL